MAIFSGIFIFCSVWISICSAINIQINNFNSKNFKKVIFNLKIFIIEKFYTTYILPNLRVRTLLKKWF